MTHIKCVGPCRDSDHDGFPDGNDLCLFTPEDGKGTRKMAVPTKTPMECRTIGINVQPRPKTACRPSRKMVVQRSDTWYGWLPKDGRGGNTGPAPGTALVDEGGAFGLSLVLPGDFVTRRALSGAYQ